MKRFLIIALMVSLSPILIWAQKTESKATIDKDTILIGEQLNMRLEVNTIENTKVSWPNFSEAFKSGVELVKLMPIDTIKLENKISYIQNLTLTSFDTGFYEIPGFDFACVDQSDTSFYKSLSNPTFLRVNTVAVDTTQAFKPIKGPIGQGYTFAEALPMIGGFILLLVVGFLVYYFFFRKSDEPLFTAKAKPRIQAHILALNGLDELKTKKLWQDGKFKAYYTELTDIFRIYLDNRFEVDAMEMTSDEIRDEIKKIESIDEKTFAKLSDTLSTSDLVKFAKMNPLPEENEKNLELMEVFVKDTMVKPEEEEKKEENTNENQEGFKN